MARARAKVPPVEEPIEGIDGEDDLERAVRTLFKAYDIDESGELSREEFLKIEMRICFEKGEVFKEEPTTAKLTLADEDRSGCLSYDEFRDRQLRVYSEMGRSKGEIIAEMNEGTKVCLAERQRMGARYHAGIRYALKRIFTLYDVSGDGSLSPEEWIAAQRVVALEINDDFDESWIDEAAFSNADTNGDGCLSMPEYLEASFQMFEGVKMRTDQILSTLQKVVHALERRKLAKETHPVAILVQKDETPEFQPPHLAWQDEPTLDAEMRNQDKWENKGDLQLPVNLVNVEDVASLLRLFLKVPADTWVAIYYIGPNPEGGAPPVVLLRDNNVQLALDYLAKPNACHKLYLKNIRPRPKRLTRQAVAFFDEREALLPRRTGQCWGLDWETQLVGDGVKLPLLPIVIMLGDAVVIEVPTSDDAGEYRYARGIYMDVGGVLSRPVEETIEPKKPKKKKKKAAGVVKEPDPMIQLSFIGLKEGKCVLFVDLSWEDQEDKLTSNYGLTAPVLENSTARVGPIEVEVQKPPAGKPADKSFVWWNGVKWSNKKGPAGKKKKKGK